MNKPKTLWAFWANQHGPWWTKPQKVTYVDDLESWWHKNQEAEITKLGHNDRDGYYITFASESKEDCQKFIDGFMACRSLLSGFFKDQ